MSTIQVTIQLKDYISVNRMAGNWMAIQLTNHLAIGHDSTIR